MSSFFFETQEISSLANETVLESLIRQGIQVHHSCKSGICQSCLLKCSEQVDSKAQKGLSKVKRDAGYFLSCQQVARPGMQVYSPNTSALLYDARIIAQERVSENVVILRVRPDYPYKYQAGQFTNIMRSDGVCRSYSIASITGAHELEFHIRRVDNGILSTWLYDRDLTDEVIKLSEAIGECTLTQEMANKNLLLVGIGTGLAPLYGVIQDALNDNSQREIHLFHGSLTFEGLYLVEQLKQLESQHHSFNYYPTYLKGDKREGFFQEDLVNSIKNFQFDGQNTIVMICGDPMMVKKIKQTIFLAGTPSRNILSDPFISKGQ